MNVLMIATWYSPKKAEVMSAGVFHYEQSMALKSYCETALYYPFDTDLDSKFEKDEERGLLTYRRKKNPYRIPKISYGIHMIQVFFDLLRIRRDFQPDVIHAHCAAGAGRAARLFCKLFGYPLVITEHSPIEQFPVNNRPLMGLIRRVYRDSSANVCVSPHSMQTLQEHFPNLPFQVIYNGIYSPQKMSISDQQFRVDGKINACIVAAFYDMQIKGYQFLIPAVARLKEKGVPFVLHICGGGDYFQHYVDLAAKLGVENECIFYGNCTKDKVYSIVSQMDFNISASIFECSGVSVEEALLIGKPVLVTRSGGANSMVDGSVSLVVDRGSEKALVDGIEAMIKKLPEFNSENISAYANERFEIDSVSRQYMDLYQKIVK